MSDDNPKPLDDLKQGLGLLFRAAKGAVDSLPKGKIEDVVKDGAKEVGKAFESLGSEIDKAWNKATGTSPPPADAQGNPGAPHAPHAPEGEAKEPEAPSYDDAYAPDGSKGPRVG
jgi:hypothetical protein